MLDEGDPRALIQIVRDNDVDILIAGGRNMYTALRACIPFLDINQEREFGYAGYEGMVELARQLVLTIDSPIWSSVRQPAPWTSRNPLPSGPRKSGEKIAKGEWRPSSERTTMEGWAGLQTAQGLRSAEYGAGGCSQSSVAPGMAAPNPDRD